MENDKNKDKTPPNKLSDQIDTPEDKKKMEETVTKVDIPDARDIPGQKHITPMPPGEVRGTTASSAGEEGSAVFQNKIVTTQSSNVSDQERKDLFIAANDMPGDDENLRRAALDSTDEDGTPLNVDSFDANISPDDLDVPGASLDDAEEKIGAEDEENNEYSIGGEGSDSQDGSPRDDF